MNYEVPKGFEDFISNAEELRKQYESIQSSSSSTLPLDAMVYSVYTLESLDDDHRSVSIGDRPMPVPSLRNLKSLHKLCAEINDFAASIVKGYVWQMDPFCVYVVKVRE